jgi:hypothetical protein
MNQEVALKAGVIAGLAILLCVANSLRVTGQQWTQCSSTQKAGGLGQAVLGTGDHIYVLRGYSSGACQFWRYDPAANSWVTLLEWSPLALAPFNPIPRPKSGTALAWDGDDQIYVLFGGAGTDTERAFFYSYVISTQTWTRLADSPHAQGAGDAMTWSGYDNALYALLGSADRGSTPARYVPASGLWESLPFNPKWHCTDDGASLAWAGGQYLYALNGEWEETVPHNDFARFDLVAQAWEDLAQIPETAATGGSAGVGDGASLLWIGAWNDAEVGVLYALGGGGVREEPGYSFYRYDTSGNSWEALAHLPCPVGEWVGNRLGYADGAIYCWQGYKSSPACGGSALLMYGL